MIDSLTLQDLADAPECLANECDGVRRLIEMGREDLAAQKVPEIREEMRRIDAALAQLTSSDGGKKKAREHYEAEAAKAADCEACEEPQAVEGDDCQQCGHGQVRGVSA